MKEVKEYIRLKNLFQNCLTFLQIARNIMLEELLKKIKDTNSCQEIITLLRIAFASSKTLNHLDSSLLEELEKSPLELAKICIQEMIEYSFEEWQEKPLFEFPIGVLSKEQSEQ